MGQGEDKGHNPDYLLIIIVFGLVVFGLVMLSSASSVVGWDRFEDNYYFLKHQLFRGAIPGIILLFFIAKVDYRKWKKFATGALIATLLLLIIVLIPSLSFEYGGARRWVAIGPLTLQPTEIAKLTFLLYLATWLEKKEKGVKDWKYGFLPFVTVLGVIGFLIMMQPDLGTLSIILISSIMVYFVAGAKLSHLAVMGAGGVVLLFLLIKAAPYRMARFTVFLNPELDPQGIGYQINQALLAIGSGGLFGRGLGKSIQKYNYLPEVTGDSIFAVVAEELGFVRVLLLIGLYLAFAYVGFRIAKKAPDMYGKLVATGITAWLSFQGFVNMAAMVSLIPLTGIPLPFVSYGGSALMFSLIAVGILINISKHTVEPKTAGVSRKSSAVFRAAE